VEQLNAEATRLAVEQADREEKAGTLPPVSTVVPTDAMIAKIAELDARALAESATLKQELEVAKQQLQAMQKETETLRKRQAERDAESEQQATKKRREVNEMYGVAVKSVEGTTNVELNTEGMTGPQLDNLHRIFATTVEASARANQLQTMLARDARVKELTAQNLAKVFAERNTSVPIAAKAPISAETVNASARTVAPPAAPQQSLPPMGDDLSFDSRRYKQLQASYQASGSGATELQLGRAKQGASYWMQTAKST